MNLRMSLFAFTLLVGVALLPSIARADCGTHAFSAVFAPAAMSVERIALTPENLTTKGASVFYVNQWSKYAQALSAVRQQLECTDEPRPVQEAVRSLMDLWRTALDARGVEGVNMAISNGTSLQPFNRACVGVNRARVRSMLYTTWNNDTSASPFARDPRAMTTLLHLPMSSHVLALYHTAAAAVGLQLPALNSARAPWIQSSQFDRAVSAALEHLPDGVQCPAVI